MTQTATAADPTLLDRIVRGVVVLADGAEREAYRLDDVVHYLPLGVRQDYRKAPAGIASTFRADTETCADCLRSLDDHCTECGDCDCEAEECRDEEVG